MVFPPTIYCRIQGACECIISNLASIQSPSMMFSATTEWSDKAKNLLRSELKRKGATYAQLSDLLHKIDVNENEKNIANKISRGVFSMAFFLQCMSAIDVTDLRL